MATTLHLATTTATPLVLSFPHKSKAKPKTHLKVIPPSRPSPTRTRIATARAYKVIIEESTTVTEIEVEADETILSKAIEEGLNVPHDCKLGVCMTCPARLVSGTVDQSEGMLSDDVIEKGYALMCASYPRSDCRIKIIPEEELLSLQLATAND